MRIALSFIFVLFLSLQLSASPVVSSGALPGWLYPTQPNLDKKPASDDISNGYYYPLLDLQTNLAAKTRYTHYIIHIVNESGVQNASEVSVTFAPEFQHVVFHRIAIIRDGAVLNQLDLSRIKVIQEEKEAGDFEYDGLKRAFYTLKDVRKGDRIEVAYSLIGFNPVFGNKFSDEFLLSRGTAICNYYKSFITTADRPLHIVSTNHAPAPFEKRQGNSIIYNWTDPEIAPTGSESDDTPSWFDKSPTIYVTEYKNWAEVINWGIKTFNDYQFSLPPPLKHQVEAWRLQSKGDKDLFANIANRYIQNEIRYLGLEIGVNTHQPHPPADVFAQGFGDCKDKALLLTAILRQEGIPAFVALVSTDTRSQLANIAPSPRTFDHAIVAIRRSQGVYTYIDPTNGDQRGELADLYIPDYGYALVLEENDTALQAVAPGRINDYTIVEKLDAKYHDSSRLEVATTYSGGAADDVRGSFADNSIKDLGERFRKYYSSLFEDIRQTSRVTYIDDSLKNTFTTHEEYAIPQLWHTDKTDEKYFRFNIGVLDQALPNPANAADDAPLALSYPHRINYTVYFTLREDWEFGDGELHIKNDSYQFDFIPHVSGNKMSLVYSFKTAKDNIPASDIRQYKEDYKKMMGLISFRLYKTAPQNQPVETTPQPREGKVCWPAVWLTFFFALFFSRLFVWLNKRGEETLYAPGTGYPLGGWLILLAISLSLTILLATTQLFRENYYSNASWKLLENLGSSLQYLMLTELATTLNAIAGGIAVLFWLIKKRDIFPRMFLWYIGISLFGQLLLIVLYSLAPLPASLNTYKTGLTTNFIRSVIISFLWSAYILRSGQVKSTFLEPFRERIH